jgi:hypothetical protein
LKLGAELSQYLVWYHYSPQLVRRQNRLSVKVASSCDKEIVLKGEVQQETGLIGAVTSVVGFQAD